MTIRTLCVSLLIAALAGPAAHGQNSLDSIDACIGRLDPQTDIGYERIAARCPDLTRRLEASSWAAWLPSDWHRAGNDLSAQSLVALRIQVARELAVRVRSHVPDPASLHGILAALGPLEPQKTEWTRFTLWLRQIFERRDPSSSEGWLDRMAARMGPSQAALELISYLCLAAVVVLAAGLVINELRLAGWLVARPARTPRGPARFENRETWGWEEIQAAPYADRPRMLLELIATRLVELGRLPPADGLTIRELTQAARLAVAEDRELLADVALAAERIRFSAEPVCAASLDAAVERGRKLLEQLRT